MGNMSYCRFENTARDMADCLEAIEEEGGVGAYIDNNSPSEYEIGGMVRFFALIDEFKDYINAQQEIEDAKERMYADY